MTVKEKRLIINVSIVLNTVFGFNINPCVRSKQSNIQHDGRFLFIKNPLSTSKQEERENLIKDRVTNLNDTRNTEKRISG